MGTTGSPSWSIAAHSQPDIGRRNEFEAAASRAGAPEHFYCPMSRRIFRDPVRIASGHVLEQRYLQRWIELGQTACPVTGEELPLPFTYEPDIALREEIEQWCSEHVQLPDIATPDAHAAVTPFNVEDAKHKSLGPNFAADDFVLAMAIQEEELDVYSAKSRLPRIRTRNRSTPSAYSESPTLSSPTRRRRQSLILNIILLAISIAYIVLFVLALWKNGWKLAHISKNPLVGPDRTALASLGSLVNSKVQRNNQWWRIPSSLFVSSGVIQLVCSVVCLWIPSKHLQNSGRVWTPYFSVPALFLLSGLTGAVVSVNLGYNLDSCGASAGICALLGAAWMEQLTCWRHIKGRIVLILALVLLTAVFAILSLLPLVGMWYSAAALLCGALLLPVVLHMPWGSQSRRNLTLTWLLRLGCLAVVVAILALGIVSILVDKSKTAQECPFCLEANCVQISSWWDCSAAGAQDPSTACSFNPNSDGTTTITCPSGGTQVVPNVSDMAAACNTACSAVSALNFGALSPASGGVLI